MTRALFAEPNSPFMPQITMLPRQTLLPAVLLAGLLLGGCVTHQPAAGPVSPAALATPAKPAVSATPAAPVAPEVKATPATITGSEESSTMFDNLTAYVAAVDGHLISAGRDGWNIPLSLSPGPHKLNVEFGRGVFTARAVLELTARAEAVYQLKFTSDAQVLGRNSYCEFWIVDTATGQPVGSSVRVPLTRLAQPK